MTTATAGAAPLPRAVRTYLDHLGVEKGLAANTLSSYRRDLRRYLAHLDACGVEDLDAVREETVTAFLVSLREGDADHPPLGAASAARTVVAVRGFHKFAVRDGLATSDPAAAVKPPTPARRLPKALPLSDVEAILEAAGADGTPRALRDRALLEVLYGTGARISEAVGLDVDDVHDVLDAAPGQGAVLLRGKGGKERMVPVGAYAREAVSAYLVRGRPALVGGTRGDAGAVPELARRTPLAPVGVDGAGLGRGARRGHPRRLAAHLAPLLRHPPARRRGRRPGRPGAARPRLGDHHAGLHPGHGGQSARGLRHRPPAGARVSDADAVYAQVVDWAAGRGLELYPHQEEALIELLSGSNVVLATPTGSGKSLVAVGALMAALAEGKVGFYTAPIKALVSEKFFELCAIFGADDVGLLTGDAAVNADAPVICCTAEVLANIALREGSGADVGLVVMDEFHFYAEPDRGWAWQVPLLELPAAQVLLMSATLGDVTGLAADLERRSGRPTAVVADAERPVPLTFTWALTPLAETLEELVATHQAPVYVVHFTQAAAVEQATSLVTAPWLTNRSEEAAARAEQRAERLAGFRFGAGFGKVLSKLLRKGVGVHHAGMLPRYRRLVEQLAQAGLLTVICGTDTLGVGINVPIRTVLFTGLAKYDGRRQRTLRTREFLQIAGRAGRAGFDSAGSVVVQAPEHVIENEKAKAKSAAKNAAMSVEKQAKRKSKPQLRKPPDGTVVWTEQTFEKLVAGVPETLVSRMKVDNAVLVNVLAREEDAFPVLRRLLTDNHEDARSRLRLARRALRLARSLLASGTMTRLDAPDEFGRRYVLTVDLPADFALNQPLAHFALAAFDVLDPESEQYTLDILSVAEAVLETPRQVLFAQQNVARGEAVAEMKADGLEYDERMALLDAVTWPRPLAELLEATYEIYRESHPWLREDALEPCSVVRDMYEQGMSFTDFVSRYQLARSEGLVLRYLTDAYRFLRQTVPEAHRTPQLEELEEWLGETVRQTDSSLLDEWEAMTDPDALARTVTDGSGTRPPRPLSQQGRAFEVMVRNALWSRVEAVGRDDLDALMRLERAAADRLDPPREVVMTRSRWDEGLEAYFAEHGQVLRDADARGPDLLRVVEDVGEPVGAPPETTARLWRVTQTLHDPLGDHDWVIEATADLDATDDLGELVLATTALRRL